MTAEDGPEDALVLATQGPRHVEADLAGPGHGGAGQPDQPQERLRAEQLRVLGLHRGAGGHPDTARPPARLG